MALLKQQEVYMNSTSIYKKSLNNALNKLYICRYIVAQRLLIEYQGIGLKDKDKLEILIKMLYYTDDETQKIIIQGKINQLKSVIPFDAIESTNIGNPIQIKASTLIKNNDELKRKAQTQFSKYKEKYDFFTLDVQKTKYKSLLL